MPLWLVIVAVVALLASGIFAVHAPVTYRRQACNRKRQKIGREEVDIDKQTWQEVTAGFGGPIGAGCGDVATITLCTNGKEARGVSHSSCKSGAEACSELNHD